MTRKAIDKYEHKVDNDPQPLLLLEHYPLKHPCDFIDIKIHELSDSQIKGYFNLLMSTEYIDSKEKHMLVFLRELRRTKIRTLNLSSNSIPIHDSDSLRKLTEFVYRLLRTSITHLIVRNCGTPGVEALKNLLATSPRPIARDCKVAFLLGDLPKSHSPISASFFKHPMGDKAADDLAREIFAYSSNHIKVTAGTFITT